MSSSTNKPGAATAVDVSISKDSLVVILNDGRSLSIPLHWFPRLVHGTDEERGDWALMGGGQGIHWARLDEDISVAGLISGIPSLESAESLSKWMEKRKRATAFPAS